MNYLHDYLQRHRQNFFQVFFCFFFFFGTPRMISCKNSIKASSRYLLRMQSYPCIYLKISPEIFFEISGVFKKILKIFMLKLVHVFFQKLLQIFLLRFLLGFIGNSFKDFCYRSLCLYSFICIYFQIFLKEFLFGFHFFFQNSPQKYIFKIAPETPLGISSEFYLANYPDISITEAIPGNFFRPEIQKFL